MQIPSLSVSSAAQRWNAAATTPVPTTGATVAHLSASETVPVLAGSQQSNAGDGTRVSLESFFQVEVQARIRTTSGSTEGAANLSKGTLRSVRQAVAIEIRQGRQGLAQQQTGDLGRAERDDLHQARRELKRAEQQFSSELKDLGPDGAAVASFDGPGGLVGSVQDSLDRLVATLAGLGSESPESGDLPPAPSGARVPAVADAPPAEFSEVLRNTLADFAERFEAFIESLSAALSSGGAIPRPAKEAIHVDAQQADSSAPSERALSSYTSIRFEFKVEVSGSVLNLAS